MAVAKFGHVEDRFSDSHSAASLPLVSTPTVSVWIVVCHGVLKSLSIPIGRPRFGEFSAATLFINEFFIRYCLESGLFIGEVSYPREADTESV